MGEERTRHGSRESEERRPHAAADDRGGGATPAADAAVPARAADDAPVPAEPVSAEPSRDEVQRLRSMVEQLKQEAHASQDRYVRERAELENFKKRMQREKVDAVRFANEPLLRDLLPAVDNLERALEHGSGATGESLLEGVRLVFKSLLDTLERHGVKRIDAIGEPFDPTHHEAIGQVESTDHPPNYVTERHQVGYALHGRLLRPALVTVSRGKTAPAVESAADGD